MPACGGRLHLTTPFKCGGEEAEINPEQAVVVDREITSCMEDCGLDLDELRKMG